MTESSLQADTVTIPTSDYTELWNRKADAKIYEQHIKRCLLPLLSADQQLDYLTYYRALRKHSGREYARGAAFLYIISATQVQHKALQADYKNDLVMHNMEH